MEVFVAIMPGEAAPDGFFPAYMAYRIGSGFQLLGTRMSKPIRGGMMLLDCRNFDGQGDPACCMRQIMGEYKRRNFCGIICDFEGPPLSSVSKLIGMLGNRVPIHVPESYAYASPAAQVMIPSSLTSGTLERRLNGARSSYGDRLTLAVEWVREDLLLPASGRGIPVSQDDLDSQIRRLEPAIFFDRGLCAHYYTYMDGPQAHFVLFDTPRSIREKLCTAKRLGLTTVLLPPEAGECGGHLFD